jgi:hypothetical protein
MEIPIAIQKQIDIFVINFILQQETEYYTSLLRIFSIACNTRHHELKIKEDRYVLMHSSMSNEHNKMIVNKTNVLQKKFK